MCVLSQESRGSISKLCASTWYTLKIYFPDILCNTHVHIPPVWVHVHLFMKICFIKIKRLKKVKKKLGQFQKMLLLSCVVYFPLNMRVGDKVISLKLEVFHLCISDFQVINFYMLLTSAISFVTTFFAYYRVVSLVFEIEH